MKQNAAIIALLVGAVAAQRREDRDEPKPIYLADKAADQCAAKNASVVSAAVSAKDASQAEVDKLKVDLQTAVEKVASERALRDQAVLDTIAKDDLFKTALAEADAAENSAMTLYKTTSDARKAYDDAVRAAAVLQVTTTSIKSRWDLADADKTAADASVQLAIAHKAQETQNVADALAAYGGNIDGLNADSGGTCIVGQCLDTKGKNTLWQTAVAGLASKKAEYDAKVIEKNDANTAWQALKVVSDAADAVRTTQLAVLGASDAAGARLAKVTAEGTLTTYGSTGGQGLKDAQDGFVTATDAAGEAWKLIAADDAANDYTVHGSLDCIKSEDASSAFWVESADNDAACALACKAKKFWGTTTSLETSNEYCYGYAVTGPGATTADKCRLLYQIEVLAEANNARGDAQCKTRKATTKAKAFYVTNTLHTKLATAVTAYTTTITTDWNTKIDAVQGATRDFNYQTAVLAYINDVYLGNNPAGLLFKTTTASGVHDGKVSELGVLLAAANALGMDGTATIATQSNAKMDDLKGAYDASEIIREAKRVEWEAQKTELARQVTTDAIAAAWKIAAQAEYDAVDALWTGVGKQSALQGTADDLSVSTLATYNAAKVDYDAKMIHADYTGKIAQGGDGEALAQAVAAERVKVDTAEQAVDAAILAEVAARGALAAEVLNCAGLEAALQVALAECESQQYKAFRTSFQEATDARQADLDKIKELMDKREKAAAGMKAGSGLAGARCERPRSNGDKRGRNKCEAELCCGAATKLIGQTEVTIETCQKADATKYSYQPPRSPMGLAMPATEDWDFACIGGAQRVLAAAAAAAAAGLMMQ